LNPQAYNTIVITSVVFPIGDYIEKAVNYNFRKLNEAENLERSCYLLENLQKDNPALIF
jgi:hypothetical protein